MGRIEEREKLFVNNPLARFAWNEFARTGAPDAYRVFAELKEYDVDKLLTSCAEDERVR